MRLRGRSFDHTRDKVPTADVGKDNLAGSFPGMVVILIRKLEDGGNTSEA
jgi:hypothetical protein